MGLYRLGLLDLHPHAGLGLARGFGEHGGGDTVGEKEHLELDLACKGCSCLMCPIPISPYVSEASSAGMQPGRAKRLESGANISHEEEARGMQTCHHKIVAIREITICKTRFMRLASPEIWKDRLRGGTRNAYLPPEDSYNVQDYTKQRRSIGGHWMCNQFPNLLPSPPSAQGTGGTRLAEQAARAGDRPDPCRTDDDEEKEAPKSGEGRRSRRRWAQERQQPRVAGSGAAVATTTTTTGAAAARRLERRRHDVGDDEDDSDHERWQPGVYNLTAQGNSIIPCGPLNPTLLSGRAHNVCQNVQYKGKTAAGERRGTRNSNLDRNQWRSHRGCRGGPGTPIPMRCKPHPRRRHQECKPVTMIFKQAI
uniref:Uncharacterized protein n=1 Tax=Oryza glumipatula TaxID=40148 RepID=A0A0E0ABW8_9ORYZ